MEIANSLVSCGRGNQTLRYQELECKVADITAAMLTKCLRELEADGLIRRTHYPTIPPTVEYAMTERGKTLIPALESVYQWTDGQMKSKQASFERNTVSTVK